MYDEVIFVQFRKGVNTLNSIRRTSQVRRADGEVHRHGLQHSNNSEALVVPARQGRTPVELS